MLVRILKPARVRVFPGMTVEVRDPAELNYLISTRSVEVLRTAAPETPEAEADMQVETRTVRKTTAARARKK